MVMRWHPRVGLHWPTCRRLLLCLPKARPPLRWAQGRSMGERNRSACVPQTGGDAGRGAGQSRRRALAPTPGAASAPIVRSELPGFAHPFTPDHRPAWSVAGRGTTQRVSARRLLAHGRERARVITQRHQCRRRTRPPRDGTPAGQRALAARSRETNLAASIASVKTARVSPSGARRSGMPASASDASVWI
jgi:hypothetical protein